MTKYICSFSQMNNAVFSKMEKEIVFNDTGYTLQSTVIGAASSLVHTIPFGETEEVKSYSGHLKIGRKKIKLKSEDFVQGNLFSYSFYDGYKAYFYRRKEAMPFLFSFHYKKINHNSIYAPSIDLNYHTKVDTILYRIKVPNNFYVMYKIEGDTSSVHLTIKKEDNNLEIVALPKRVLKENETVRSLDPYPFINLAVIPHSHKEDPFHYINDRYLKLLENKTTLSKELKEILLKTVEDCNTDSCKISQVYDLVRHKISYIAIENGVNAFVPRDVNSTYHNKYGDCKDMSNLLCQSLQFLGYDAKMALSSTIDKVGNIDFPSYAAANHMICVLEQSNDSLLYLDATDPNSPFGLPSRHTQNKNIYILDEQGGYQHYISPANPQKNKCSYLFDIKVVNDSLDINYKMCFKGHSSSLFKSLMNEYSSKDKRAYLSAYLKEVFKQKVDDFEILEKPSQIEIAGNIKYKGKILKRGNIRYVQNLPDPNFHTFDKVLNEKIENKEYMYQTNLLEVNYHFTFANEVNIRQQELDKSSIGIHLNYRSFANTAKNGGISIVYTCPLLMFEQEQKVEYNKINNMLLGALQKPFVYEIKP